MPTNPATDGDTYLNTGGLVHPDWLRRLNLFGDAVGTANRMVSLDADEMLNTAAESTGYSDFGDEHRWEEGYRAMVAALEANAALTVFGRLSARGEILRNLQTRLRLVDLWRQHPEFITMHELRSHLPCECVHFVQPECSELALGDDAWSR